jgi:hypothetical protein
VKVVILEFDLNFQEIAFRDKISRKNNQQRNKTCGVPRLLFRPKQPLNNNQLKGVLKFGGLQHVILYKVS